MIRFTIGELQQLAARLDMVLDIEDDDSALVWDDPTAAALTLLEKTYRDIGDLARAWCEITLRRKHDDGLG